LALAPLFPLLSSPPLPSSTPPAPTELSTLSLHDALPICEARRPFRPGRSASCVSLRGDALQAVTRERVEHVRENLRARGVILRTDRKSTRLNSSHVSISYAVFCLKKKKRKMYYE